MISFAAIVRNKLANGCQQRLLTNRIIRSRQDSFMLRTMRSAWLARHSSEHVIILFERLQPFSTELALHGERNPGSMILGWLLVNS